MIATPTPRAQRWTRILDGERLRRIRRERLLSQEQLAARAGISLATVRRLEHQPTAHCRSRTLVRLAAALHEELPSLTPAGRLWPQARAVDAGQEKAS